MNLNTNQVGQLNFEEAKLLIEKTEKEANKKIMQVLNRCSDQVVISTTPPFLLKKCDGYPIDINFEKRDNLEMYAGPVFGQGVNPLVEHQIGYPRLEVVDEEKPSLTIVIKQGDYKGEFTLCEPLFETFEDAKDALQKFIQAYRGLRNDLV